MFARCPGGVLRWEMGRGVWRALMDRRPKPPLLSWRLLFVGSEGGNHTFQKLAIFFKLIEGKAKETNLIKMDIVLINRLKGHDGPFDQGRVLSGGREQRALLVHF